VVADAPIITDPVTPRIPHGTVVRGTGPGGITRNPMAKADSSRTRTDGSALFIVNKWGFKTSRTVSGSHRTKIHMRTCTSGWHCICVLVTLDGIGVRYSVNMCGPKLGMTAVPTGIRCSSTNIHEVQVRVMSVEFVYACLVMARIKTGETRKTRHVANCEGTYVALHAQRKPKGWHEREMPKMLHMLREMWP
jgi:hypothetical protein